MSSGKLSCADVAIASLSRAPQQHHDFSMSAANVAVHYLLVQTRIDRHEPDREANEGFRLYPDLGV